MLLYIQSIIGVMMLLTKILYIPFGMIGKQIVYHLFTSSLVCNLNTTSKLHILWVSRLAQWVDLLLIIRRFRDRFPGKTNYFFVIFYGENYPFKLVQAKCYETRKNSWKFVYSLVKQLILLQFDEFFMAKKFEAFQTMYKREQRLKSLKIWEFWKAKNLRTFDDISILRIWEKSKNLKNLNKYSTSIFIESKLEIYFNLF